eukprot:snap_masked-scaffold1216_size55193-processed-gene-0.1 protein:Tk10889 transcript:snap_masked-scaffold1216_size55193-processed-gene-0.1-mRNA-1 annotation:"hypothetical protein AaeL_AAEL001299"
MNVSKFFAQFHLGKPLTVLFAKLGYFLGERCQFVFLLSFWSVLSNSFWVYTTGLPHMRYETNIEKLFIPKDAMAWYERSVLEEFFPMNYQDYYPGHEVKIDPGLAVLIRPTEGPSILNSAIWADITALDNLVHNVIELNDGIGFKDICVQRQGACLKNSILELNPYINEIEGQTFNLTYPKMSNPVTGSDYFLPAHFGGVQLRPDKNTLLDASSMRLFYIFDGSEQKLNQSKAWEVHASLWLASLKFSHIHIEMLHSQSLERELVRNIDSAFDYLEITVGLVTLFITFNSMNHKLGLTRLIVGLLGLLNTVLWTFLAFALTMKLGYDWQAINLASIFLLLGVGLDDTFVMLASWKETKHLKSIPERLSQTYREAGVSITITSLTNILSFCVGAVVPGFPCVEIFCVYAGFGLAAIYFGTLTLFGPGLAFLYTIQDDILAKIPRLGTFEADWIRRLPSGSELCRRLIGSPLTKGWVQGLILSVWVIYLSISAYGATLVGHGLEPKNLLRRDSMVYNFFEHVVEDYHEYAYRVQIVILAKMDYSDPEVQLEIKLALDNFRLSPWMSNVSSIEENWLQVYLESPFSPNEAGGDDFIGNLKKFLDEFPTLPVVQNVKFDPTGTRIIASRFLLQSSSIKNSVQEQKLIQDLRRVAQESPLEIVIHNPTFILYDQSNHVVGSTSLSAACCTLAMFLVALLLIPKVFSSCLIVIAIISILVGMMGSMYLAQINVDVISMINIIISIGFSVDFSAHITHHFISSSEPDPNERIMSSLEAFGLPIIQSALSTILGVLPLFFINSYILQSFATMMTLVICLGALHGLVFLPVGLSVMLRVLSLCHVDTTVDNSTPPMLQMVNLAFENDASDLAENDETMRDQEDLECDKGSTFYHSDIFACEPFSPEPSSSEPIDPAHMEPTCPICSKPAGKHSYYGAQTCVSCRGFFRRSVQSNHHSVFKCLANGNCSIDSGSRRSCKLCRYQKCVQAGMNPSYVLTNQQRKERIVKRYKSKIVDVQGHPQAHQTTGTMKMKKHAAMVGLFTLEEEQNLLINYRKWTEFAYIKCLDYFSDHLDQFDMFMRNAYYAEPIPLSITKAMTKLDENIIVSAYFNEDEVQKLPFNDRMTLITKNFPIVYGLCWGFYSLPEDMNAYMEGLLSFALTDTQRNRRYQSLVNSIKDTMAKRRKIISNFRDVIPKESFGNNSEYENFISDTDHIGSIVTTNQNLDPILMFLLFNFCLYATEFPEKLEATEMIGACQQKYLHLAYRYLRFKYPKRSSAKLHETLMITLKARNVYDTMNKSHEGEYLKPFLTLAYQTMIPLRSLLTASLAKVMVVRGVAEPLAPRRISLVGTLTSMGNPSHCSLP